jgi:hypothetical protein
MVKSTIVVERGDGQRVGEIRQDNVFGAITLLLSADGVFGRRDQNRERAGVGLFDCRCV